MAGFLSTSAALQGLAGLGFACYARGSTGEGAKTFLQLAAAGTLIWSLIGFSLVAAPGLPSNVIGNTNLATINNVPYQYGAVGGLVLESLQFALFAAAIAFSGVAHRFSSKALVVMAALWLIVDYAPQQFWMLTTTWGWMKSYGVQDVAGGLTMHCTGGVAALVLGLLAGGKASPAPYAPALLPVILGSMFLNSAAFTVTAPVGLGLLSTYIAVSGAVVSYAVLQTLLGGLLSGAKGAGKVTLGEAAEYGMVGVAAVASGAGIVAPMWWFLISFVAVTFVFLTKAATKKVSVPGYQIFLTHFLGGAVGVACTGLFSTRVLGAADDGSFNGNPIQLGKQCAGISVIILMTGLTTAIVYFLIGAVGKYVFQKPILVAEEEQASK